MIIFRTPKGWTGPKFVDDKPVVSLQHPAGHAVA
jgi:phosphoketolase